MNPAKNKTDEAYMVYIPNNIDFRKVELSVMFSGIFHMFKPINILNWVLHLRKHNVNFMVILYSIDVFYGQIPILKLILAFIMAGYILSKGLNWSN